MKASNFLKAYFAAAVAIFFADGSQVSNERPTVQKPGNCLSHPDYPETIQCAGTNRCLSYLREFNNSKCDCCGPTRICQTCYDHSDEDGVISGDNRPLDVSRVDGPRSSSDVRRGPTVVGSLPGNDGQAQNPCHMQMNQGKCEDPDAQPSLRWYFDGSRSECLAFTYYGCGGNGNRFRTRMECSMECEKVDGPICAMDRRPVDGRVVSASGSSQCAHVQCPSTYRCKQGPQRRGIPKCCPIQTELLYETSHSERGLCGRYGTPMSLNEEIMVGASCGSLLCPRNHECKSNIYFANCCQMRRRFKRDQQTDNETQEIPAWVNSGKFQGDMAGFENQSDFDAFIEQINEWQQQMDAKHKSSRQNSAVSDPRRLWPDGRVPYVIASSNWRLKKAITDAIKEFHDNTCIRFVQRSDEDDTWLNIIDNDVGCFSSMGKNLQPGPQDLSLSGSVCHDRATVLHEFMHAIGFWHEHQRTDRNQYIEVLQSNIDPGCYRRNYAIARTDQMLLLGKYDVDSIMHYPSNVCAKSARRTMKLKNSNRQDFGFSKHLSSEDIKKIRFLYGCSDLDNSASPLSSACSDGVTTHYSGSDGTMHPVCAVVYKQSHCRGDALSLAPGWAADDLSLPKYSSWNDAIVSLEINPNCSVLICSDRHFSGHCLSYSGYKKGRNIESTAALERDVSSVRCDCPRCPAHVPTWYEKDSKKFPICGTVYDKTNCGGNSWNFSIYWDSDLQGQEHSEYGDWNNRIKSVAVGRGCTMKLCSAKSYTGICTSVEGASSYGSVAVSLNHAVSSLWCTCTALADRDAWYGVVTRGSTPPQLIPGGIYKEKVTCAVAVQDFSSEAWGYWIPNGADVSSRDQNNIFALSYIVVRPRCALHYCDEANFRGRCDNLGSNISTSYSYIPINDRGYSFYNLKSYKCNCTL